MNKIKLLGREFDGMTPVEATPKFELVQGWNQATLPAPAGILPAGLWNEVPGGDPYLLHVSVLTTGPLAAGDFVELQSGSPVQPRRQYQPTPSNTVLLLVRPTDRLRFVIAAQKEIAIELLVESIGGTNELGSRLHDWAQATQTQPRVPISATRDRPPSRRGRACFTSSTTRRTRTSCCCRRAAWCRSTRR